jgi:hypothetical protein
MAMSTLIHPHSALQELIDIWIQNPTCPSFDKLGENGGKWWKMVENGGKWVQDGMKNWYFRGFHGLDHFHRRIYESEGGSSGSSGQLAAGTLGSLDHWGPAI